MPEPAMAMNSEHTTYSHFHCWLAVSSVEDMEETEARNATTAVRACKHEIEVGNGDEGYHTVIVYDGSARSRAARFSSLSH